MSGSVAEGPGASVVDVLVLGLGLVVDELGVNESVVVGVVEADASVVVVLLLDDVLEAEVLDVDVLDVDVLDDSVVA